MGCYSFNIPFWVSNGDGSGDWDEEGTSVRLGAYDEQLDDICCLCARTLESRFDNKDVESLAYIGAAHLMGYFKNPTEETNCLPYCLPEHWVKDIRLALGLPEEYKKELDAIDR